MKTYKHIFFDLDRTLYDFDRSNRETLNLVYNIAKKYQQNGIVELESFLAAYRMINKGLWDQYKKQEITKQELNFRRFSETLNELGMDSRLAPTLANEYIRLSSLQTHLIPDAIEILQYLFPKYQLHIITNGFAEIQYAKLNRSGLARFFRNIIVSEEAGAQKPDARIFHHAFNITGALAGESLLIGDDPHCDIFGGINAGMDQVWIFLPGETTDYKPTFALGNLMELKTFL